MLSLDVAIQVRPLPALERGAVDARESLKLQVHRFNMLFERILRSEFGLAVPTREHAVLLRHDFPGANVRPLAVVHGSDVLVAMCQGVEG